MKIIEQGDYLPIPIELDTALNKHIFLKYLYEIIF